jgi:hypothetical protein
VSPPLGLAWPEQLGEPRVVWQSVVEHGRSTATQVPAC